MHPTLSTERWLRVPDFPDYEVSDQGRLRSWKPWRGTPVPRPITGYDCRPDGYLQVSLASPLRRPHVDLMHSIVALAFLGPRPEGQEVRHLDGNPRHNALANLAYGTRSDNMNDAVRHGTHCRTAKTECPHGHPYDEKNTYQTARARRCRACLAAKERRYRAAKKLAGGVPVAGL